MITGYQGFLNPAQQIVIASGQQVSGAIPTGGFTLCGFILPAAFTGTAITFQVCETIDGTFKDLYDQAGAQVSVTVAAGRAYAVDPKYFYGVAFLKIKSGTAEAASRTVLLSLKGF